MLLVKVKFKVIMYLIYLMGPPMKLGMTLQGHDVIESKPDYKVEDLRLHNPYPELQRFCYTMNFSYKVQGWRTHNVLLCS
jgi:hypothetical protein